MLGKKLLLLASASLSACEQYFVDPPDDLISTVGSVGVPVRYKQVPSGICETQDDVQSYSGYADVADDQSLFFWFFEAREVDPASAPLTVYTDGGPGTSAMIGLFQNIGPCKVNNKTELIDNPYSWSRKSNLLFIDSPTTTGFSYSSAKHGFINFTSNHITALDDSDGCPSYVQDGGDAVACGTFSDPEDASSPDSTNAAAPLFWKALQGFLGVFPKYNKNGVHFATESYGGHYGPIFSAYIQEQNKNQPDNFTEIELKSLIINNGWFDPNIQMESYYNFTVLPGNTYNYFPFHDVPDAAREFHDAVYGSNGCIQKLHECASSDEDDETCAATDKYCTTNVILPIESVADRYSDDIRQPLPGNISNTFIDYLNRDHVLKGIGAFTNFTANSLFVQNLFAKTGDDSKELGISSTIRSLLDDNVYVVLFNGDADVTCDWIGVQAVTENSIKPAGFENAGFANVSTSNEQVDGVVRQAGHFAFLRVYNAGHQVPYYKPVLSLEMFERALNGTDIETGQTQVLGDGAVADYATAGDKTSDYTEGNSTIVCPDSATQNCPGYNSGDDDDDE